MNKYKSAISKVNKKLTNDQKLYAIKKAHDILKK